MEQLITISGGTYLMGSPASADVVTEQPLHEVVVAPFRLASHLVTNEEYAQYLTVNPRVILPRYWKNPRFNQSRQPVIGISWDEAVQYAAWVGCRLPTEAEWEYVCRAGSTGRWPFGDNEDMLGEYAWFSGTVNNGQTHDVGRKQPNAWGVFDLLGNVWEWCQDTWIQDYTGAPLDGSARENGNPDLRVLRGGSWFNLPGWVRSAFRFKSNRDYRGDNIGFRLAQDV